MSTVMGYEITVDTVSRSQDGVAHLVTMRARHPSGASRGYMAIFSIVNGRLRKTGHDRDIPPAILETMRRQAAAILREGRGVPRGKNEKNGRRSRVRQEDAARERMRNAKGEGYGI